MAEAGKSPIRGVLDGDIGFSNLTASDRGQQAQSDIDVAIAAERARAVVALASSSAPSAVQLGQIATTSPGSGSGGYHFDAETIAQRIKDWQQVLDDIVTDEVQLKAAMEKANPPSPDTPAKNNARDTQASLKAAIDQNMAMQQYAQAWIDTLRKANGTYAQTDHDTSKGLPNTGSATDGSALNK